MSKCNLVPLCLCGYEVSLGVEMRDSVDTVGSERYRIAEIGLLVLVCAF